MSTGWKVVLGVAAALLAVNIGLRAVDDATRDPEGPASSSFSTTPLGAAAYAELLERYEHPVIRLRQDLAEAKLDPGATLVLLDPGQLGLDDLAVLSRLVSLGGRVIASGQGAAALGSELELEPRGAPAVRDVDDALRSVDRVRTAGEGSWSAVGEERVLLGTNGAPLLVEHRVGSGRAFLLADSSPLQNRLLAEADNAALGLELAGPRRRPVVFVESVHGYGEATGIQAIPRRWWWVLGGLAIAALLHALASGKRFGPPEREHRELPPPRAEFADAIATSVAKTRPRSRAVATARRVVRERLARAARLPIDAPADSFRRAAGELRLDGGSVDTLLGERVDDGALLELGQLLGDLERKEARV